jgi:hypothetical protein
MIVNMSEKATEQEINHVIERSKNRIPASYHARHRAHHRCRGRQWTHTRLKHPGCTGVDNVIAIAQQTLSEPARKPERTVVNVNGVAIGALRLW